MVGPWMGVYPTDELPKGTSGHETYIPEEYRKAEKEKKEI